MTGLARKMAIHQILPSFFSGDAIGNQAYRMRELLRAWGFESQVFAQFRDRRLVDPGLDYTRYRPNPDNILIYHHSVGSPVADFVRDLPDRVILYYHNVTPARFLRAANPGLADLLDKGRRELEMFKTAPYALAASEYDRQELLALGFKEVEVLPLFVYFDELMASAGQPAGRAISTRYPNEDWVNILFVGRLVPNKCQGDLIWAFNYYHTLVNPHSRLLLVGSDVNAPGYRLQLETLVSALGLDHVDFAGSVSFEEGFGGYYRAASVFLCLSEHEGFCVPIIEAMRFGVPVIAYDCTGVPCAMGGAGVLVCRKRYDVIGELIHLLASEPALRQRVIEHQRARVDELAPQAVAMRFRDVVRKMG